jgi:biopolymer transport protein ExbB
MSDGGWFDGCCVEALQGWRLGDVRHPLLVHHHHGVIVERALYLFGASINKDVFLATMQKCILAGDVAKAVKMCSAANAPLARIVQAGLVKVNRPDEEVQAAMDEAALREIPRIAKRTGYLALLANLSMLSGLLGTVSGLITSFGAVSGESVDPSQKARILAEGISEAMNCTAFGLIVAIIGLIGFAVLNGKTQTLEDDINEASVQVLNLVITNRQKVNMAGLPADRFALKGSGASDMRRAPQRGSQRAFQGVAEERSEMGGVDVGTAEAVASASRSTRRST